MQEALAAYRNVLAADPACADALHLAGLVVCQLGDLESGIALVRRAIELNPSSLTYYGNLANLLEKAGRLPEAIASLEHTSRVPGATPAVNVRLSELHLRLAEQTFGARQFREAEASCRRALELLPDNADARIRLAAALTAQDNFADALEQLERAAGEAPQDPSVHSLRGVALLSTGELTQAVAAFRRAVRLQPDFAPAHYNLGVARLLLGQLRAGWREYETRGANTSFQGRRGETSQPVWRGQRLHGKRILLQAEQGYGDAMQFVRYAPFVAARGGQVILECLPALRGLLSTVQGVSEIVTTEEPLPPFDLRAPLMSLPRLFDTRLGTIPARVPYLTANSARTRHWRRKLGSYSGVRVALAWRGNAANVHNARRSLTTDLLAELANLANVHFFLLERREPGESPISIPPGLALTNLEPELTDFAETAAIVECMDLTISVDTALAHLAGALGRPVWLLLPNVPDWRWLLDRADSPWYPTARLFRQPERDAWSPVLAQVRAALHTMAQG